MIPSKTLRVVLVFSVLTIVLFPLYAIFVQDRLFASLLTEHTSDDAVRLATYFSSVLIKGEDDMSRSTLPGDIPDRAREFQRDFRFVKLKIFTPSGEIIYSTDPADIGKVNTEEYFRNIIETGRPYTEVVKKNSQSLEGQVIPADVVETYVPIKKEGRVLGAFEIYHDITSEKQRLNTLLFRSSGMVLLIAVIMLAGIVVSSNKATRSIRRVAESEQERERLILELRDALSQIKTLKGMLPICYSCKKIRDDRGYWNQLEAYIHEHTEAEFSYGICPECAKRLTKDVTEETGPAES